MMSSTVDIHVSFPDPVTGLGIVVNTLDLKVYDVYDNEIQAFTLDDVQRVDSLLLGVVYTLAFPVDDPAVTPGTYVKSIANGTVGDQVVGPIQQTHWFAPQVQEATAGVLLTWSAPELLDPKQGTSCNTLYYEIERTDSRILSVATQTQFSPEAHTLGFWTFDSTLDDAAASPANFTISGSVGYEEGKINSGVVFRGGYLTAGNPSKFQFAAGQDFSFSFWVRPDYPTSLPAVVFGKYLDSTQKGYAVLMEFVNNQFLAGVYLGGLYTHLYRQSSTSLTGGWHHLAISVDRDGDATLYIDGVKDLSFDASQLQNDVFDFYDLTVGANTNGASAFMGAADELIVFNGCLTALDAEKLYKDQFGRSNTVVVGRTEFTQFVDDTVEQNDIHYYRWDVWQVWTNGSQTQRSKIAMLTPKDVFFTSAPMCLVEGRVRMPNDAYPPVATAKFFIAHWDRGQIVHDRIVDREEIEVPINASGRFGAYLIQDAVVVCHIPDAHIKWRFAVPRKSRASLQDMTVQKLKFRNNL